MNYATKTTTLISDYKSQGFNIVENRDPNWNSRNNRPAGAAIVKIAHTNDRMLGFPKCIVWAIKATN